MKKRAAILLAAGKSERFMQTSTWPKPLYPYEEKRWIEYLIESCPIEEKIIITGEHHELFLKYLPQYENLFLYNVNHEQGSFSSLLCALKNIDADEYMIIPSDMAAPSLSTYKALMAQDQSKKAVLPQIKGKRGHPVLIRKAFANDLINNKKPNLAKRLDHEINSLNSQEIQIVPVNDKAIRTNFNTESDMLSFLKDENIKKKRIDHLGNQAGLLALIEVGLGSLLHGLRIPFSGHFLSLNQGYFLTRSTLLSKEWDGRKTDPALISNVTATLKSLSPAGKKLTPMLALSMQGNLYTLGIYAFGNNLAGQLLAMTLLSLWSFIQPLAIYFIIFGEDLAFMAQHFLKKLEAVFSITEENLLFILGSLILIKIFIGSIIVFLTRNLSHEKLNSYEERLQRIGKKKEVKKKQGRASVMALKDLTNPFFIFTMLLSLLFFIYSKSQWSSIIWSFLRPLAMAYILFYFSRKINLKKLSDSLESSSFPIFGKSLKKAIDKLKRDA